MTSVEEFIEARNSIESLAKQIILCAGRHALQDSRTHLDEAARQLEVLKSMVANDVQVVVAGRLSRQLAVLENEVQTMAAKAAKVPVKRVSTRKKTVKAEKAEKAV
ncbi:MAG TPA: hypothetical protein VGJ94_02840 [Syntrophorhabdaceae bacterium]|jgi:hypothetical protein